MSKLPKLTRKIFPLHGGIFLAFMVFYCEAVLHLWITESLNYSRLLVVAGFGLGLGSLLGIIVSFLPKSARKWTSIVVSVLFVLFYIMEFFLSETYQNFMTVQTILSGAGGIAQDYLLLTVKMIGRNLGRIILMFLPIVVYSLWCYEPILSQKSRVTIICTCLLCYMVAFCTLQDKTRDTALVSHTYNFDSVVRRMGLNIGLVLDTVQNIGTEKAPEFAHIKRHPQTSPTEAPAVETLPPEVPSTQTVPPTETTAPTETSPPETAAPETVPEETEPEPTQPKADYGYSVLPIDFGAAANDRGQAPVASIHNYVNSLTPSRQNEFTGMFKGKNLILITAEAFSAEVIDPELTPTLYRMATQGIQFKEYYQPAWGASTTTGEFSNLIGLVPINGGSSMNETYQQNLFLTMGNQLQKLGYYSTAYHNHIKDFYHRNNTHPHLGYDKFVARYGGLEGLSDCWPESDLEMIDITTPEFIDNQPFSIYYMTVSGHCEYTLTGNDMTEKNWDKVQHLEHSDIVKGYIAANLEFEYAMESLVRQLEEAGIADDTLIVIATDHYPYGLERSTTWQNTVDHLAELYGVSNYDQFQRDHSALIMWSGAFEGMNIVVDTPVYSLDILPTVSNLFGVEWDSRLLVGRDVFSDAEPLVLWPNYSWLTDKGTFNGNKFTPREGVTVDSDYVEHINSIVKNKITFSKSVVDFGYYDYVLRLMEK